MRNWIACTFLLTLSAVAGAGWEDRRDTAELAVEQKSYSEAYRIYCLRVPRWIPAWRQEGKPGHARGRKA